LCREKLSTHAITAQNDRVPVESMARIRAILGARDIVLAGCWKDWKR
jgi:hypothetical protein